MGIELGERKPVADAANQVAAVDLNAFLVFQETQRIFNDLERQTKHARQVQTDKDAPGIQRLHDKIAKEANAQTGLLHRLWRGPSIGQCSAVPIKARRFGAANHGVISPMPVSCQLSVVS